VLTNVWIRSKRGLDRGIVENDGLLHAQDIVKHRFWQQILGYDIVTRIHDHPIAIGRGFGCDPQRLPLQQKQQTSLGSGLLDRGTHQRPDQLFLNDFA
jgi:hypothetical protein